MLRFDFNDYFFQVKLDVHCKNFLFAIWNSIFPFQAEDLVLNGFPEKIMQLNDLLETPAFCSRNFSDIHQELNVPIPDPIIFSNKIGNCLEPSAKKSKIEDGIQKCSCEGIGGTRVLLLPTGQWIFSN